MKPDIEGPEATVAMDFARGRGFTDLVILGLTELADGRVEIAIRGRLPLDSDSCSSESDNVQRAFAAEPFMLRLVVVGGEVVDLNFDGVQLS